MRFKVKDLMIDVAGATAAKPAFPCVTGTIRCCVLTCTHLPTPCLCTHLHTPCFCTHILSQCLPCTHHGHSWIACEVGTAPCGVSFEPTTPIIERTPVLVQEEISPLKEQLKAALELVERQEAAINEELRPKTLEEVANLETKLTEALEQIKAQKAELSKKK